MSEVEATLQRINSHKVSRSTPYMREDVGPDSATLEFAPISGKLTDKCVSHEQGIVGTIIVDKEGKPIRTTVDVSEPRVRPSETFEERPQNP